MTTSGMGVSHFGSNFRIFGGNQAFHILESPEDLEELLGNDSTLNGSNNMSISPNVSYSSPGAVLIRRPIYYEGRRPYSSENDGDSSSDASERGGDLNDVNHSNNINDLRDRVMNSLRSHTVDELDIEAMQGPPRLAIIPSSIIDDGPDGIDRQESPAARTFIIRSSSPHSYSIQTSQFQNPHNH